MKKQEILTVGITLHSTIFILKRFHRLLCLVVLTSLHSTIFILKQRMLVIAIDIADFTFYYIYIKTRIRLYWILYIQSLHSTIFILKHNWTK